MGQNKMFYTVKNQNFGFTKKLPKKLSPKTSKNCQNGEKLPHLVTLNWAPYEAAVARYVQTDYNYV